MKKATGGAFFTDLDSPVDISCLPVSQFLNNYTFLKNNSSGPLTDEPN
jgi:hypothetical protein